jgi:dTDP-4-amino-4,6-dideoxy-D-galactose acyltransferase
MFIEPLTWDSAWLGLRVGKLSAHRLSWAAWRAARREARREGYKLLYWAVDPLDSISAKTAARAGLSPVDCRLTFEGASELADERRGASVQRLAGEEQAPQLRELALLSGGYSRFRLDPRISQDAYRRLYQQWLHNALTDPASAVLAEPDGADGYCGLLTLRPVDEYTAQIDLLAVAPAAQRQGVGQRLVRAALTTAGQWGCRRVLVSTQLANRPACRLYAAAGMRVQTAQLQYHVWL